MLKVPSRHLSRYKKLSRWNSNLCQMCSFEPKTLLIVFRIHLLCSLLIQFKNQLKIQSSDQCETQENNNNKQNTFLNEVMPVRSTSKAHAQVGSRLTKHIHHQLIYRLVEVQGKAEEERVAAFKLKAHRGQLTHKVNQIHHWILEPRQSHVSRTEGRAESHTETLITTRNEAEL